MHYSVDIEIDLPRDRVIELFDSTENLYKWQRGLQSFEHIEGEPGHPQQGYHAHEDQDCYGSFLLLSKFHC